MFVCWVTPLVLCCVAAKDRKMMKPYKTHILSSYLL